MTIAKTGSEASYAGNGATVAFAFAFRFFDDTDLQVFIVVDATGVATLQTLTTDYTIVNTGTEAGGTVTMVVAPASGETLLIQRQIPETQSTDYQNNDAFPAETHEVALDRLTLIDQQISRSDGQHLTLPTGDTASPILPVSGTRSDKVFGFDSSGGILMLDTTVGISATFELRSEFVTSVSGGLSIADGGIIAAGGILYVADSTATTIADLPGWLPFGDAHPDHWGAVRSQSLAGADGIADSLAAFQALLTYTGNGRVNLLGGYYRVSATLDVTNEVIFYGQGSKRSLIHGNFTSGAIVRFFNRHSGTWDCGTTGGVTRRAAALDTASPGMQFEAIDDAGETGRMQHCNLRNPYSFGHPGAGIQIVGPAFTGDIINPDISSCKSHGICFDRGQATGRTNLLTSFIGGICPIIGGRVVSCGGHYVACGRPDDAFSTPVLRVEVRNMEGGSNATDAAATFEDAAFYFRGTGYILSNCGISHATSMAYVAGRNIRLDLNRWLDSDGTGSAYTIATYDELPTDGVFIDNVNIVVPSAPLDPLVAVTVPAGETTEPKNIFMNQAEMGNITSLIKTDSTMGSGGANRVPGLILNGDIPVVRKTANQVVNNSTSTISDDDLKFWMMADEKIFFRLTLIVDGSATADLRWLINKPSGATNQYGSPNSIKVAVAGGVSEVSPVTTGVITNGLAGVGTDRFVDITGFCTNGSTPGDITLQWAQLVAEGNDLTIKAGSVLEVKRLLS